MTIPTNIYNRKEYYYKVYGKSAYEWDAFNWDVGNWSLGTEKNLISVWRNEVISDPSYRSTINSGDAELQVKLARKFDNYGEDLDISLNNTVQLWVTDKEKPNGKLLFTGIITGYAPTLDNDNQYLTVWIKGITITMANRLLRDSTGKTTIDYFSKDPAYIFKDIITKFRDNDLGEINYTSTSVQNTNTTVTYTFNTVTYKEALDKVIELCPYTWFYRIDADGTAYLQPKSTEINHQISTKKDIVYLQPEINIDDFANDVYFVGGETAGANLFLRKQNLTSIDDYGQVVKRITDGRVTNSATAQIMANRVLLEKSTPARRTVAKIIDSNGTNYPSNIGYDIESIKVGQNIQISEITGAIPNPTKWDNFYWDGNLWDNVKNADVGEIMQITSVTYNPDYVEIEATTRLPEISKRIEDIQRNLNVNNYLLNPVSPTNI